MSILFLSAITPIILVLVLLLVFNLKLMNAATISLCAASALALGLWGMHFTAFLSSFTKGAFVGLDIAIIIAGALFFMQFFTQTKRLDTFKRILDIIHPDLRVQTIFLAVFFVAFIEGTAGFGTPAAVVVPLLVAFGISPVYSVAIALIGDGVPAMFGAVSTPILVGFEGLDYTATGSAALLATPLVVLSSFVILAYIKKSRTPLPAGSMSYRSLIPFILWANVCYIVPFVTFAFIAHEVASLFGSLIGMIILGITTAKGWFVQTPQNQERHEPVSFRQGFDALLPYLIFIALLFSGKLITLKYSLDFGYGITHTLNFHNPGVLFFTSIGLTALIAPRPWQSKKAFTSMSKKLIQPFIAILCFGTLVQIFIHTDKNTSELPSMISYMAKVLENNGLVFLSSFIGMLGAFVSGSTTVSNLLFAHLQASAASTVGFPVASILSLQLIGSAVGNMISLANIIAAQSTVGLVNCEKKILNLTIWPCLASGVIIGILAWIFY